MKIMSLAKSNILEFKNFKIVKQKEAFNDSEIYQWEAPVVKFSFLKTLETIQNDYRGIDKETGKTELQEIEGAGNFGKLFNFIQAKVERDLTNRKNENSVNLVKQSRLRFVSLLNKAKVGQIINK